MRVLKVVLTLRWLGYTLLAVAAIALFVFLGKWQWNRSQASDGTIQNLFYAFNWWLFACLVVYGFGKTLHEDITDAVAPERNDEIAPRPTLPALYRKPRPVELDEPAEDDPELAAYNAYLARLNNRTDH